MDPQNRTFFESTEFMNKNNYKNKLIKKNNSIFDQSRS